MIKIINNIQCLTLGTYLKKDMPRERKEYIKREIRKTIRTAKEILMVNNSETFDSFKYKGGLITCLNEISSINTFIVTYGGYYNYRNKWVAELYELTLKIKEAIKYTDEMIGSLRSQDNYHGVYNIKEGVIL